MKVNISQLNLYNSIHIFIEIRASVSIFLQIAVQYFIHKPTKNKSPNFSTLHLPKNYEETFPLQKVIIGLKTYISFRSYQSKKCIVCSPRLLTFFINPSEFICFALLCISFFYLILTCLHPIFYANFFEYYWFSVVGFSSKDSFFCGFCRLLVKRKFDLSFGGRKGLEKAIFGWFRVTICSDF